MENHGAAATILAAIFALLANSVIQSVRAEEPLAKITVEAGKYTRIDTPVSVSLGDMSELLSKAEFCLEEIKGSQRHPVAKQIEFGNPARLWWILYGTTKAGTKRVYEVVKGRSYVEKTAFVKATKNDSFLEIQTRNKKILRYNHALMPPPEGKDPLYIRSGFIHPLWSPGGAVLTTIHPEDHIHHMGIWMPWTKTKFEGREVDFWNLNKGQGTVRFVEFIDVTSGPVFGGFGAVHEHVDLSAPGGEKVALNEEWDVRVYNVGGPEKGHWLWDFVSTQRCASQSPLYQEKYRYGGLGFRAAVEWVDENGKYLTSEGKTRKDGHATRARWCDMSGPVGKNWGGVTMMSHPKNLHYPEPVRIWPAGAVFFNFAPSQLSNWTMEPGKNYVFRYRFYVHEDKIRVADAERFWRDFAEPPKITLEKKQP